MIKKGIKILGIGQSVPSYIVDNKTIETITPGSKAEWIEDKLGIKERRVVKCNENVVSLGAQAAKEAINDSGLSLDEIDLLIVNTSSSDHLSPSVACMIQNKLKLKCPAFDINAVCSGFLYSLELSSHLLESYKNILLISTETYSRIIDWLDPNSCFFGDGSASVIVTRSNNIFYSEIGAIGKGYENFMCERKSTFKMNGKEVYKFGSTVLPFYINKLLMDNEVDIEEVDYIVPHQPSHNILKSTAKQLNIPESKIIFNMMEYANTAGASVPMALYKGIKTNTIKSGHNILLAAIGSGWTYGVIYLKLEYK